MMQAPKIASSGAEDHPILSGLSTTHALMALPVTNVVDAMAWTSDLDFISKTGKMVKPEAFQDAVDRMPKSSNIEDRREEGGLEEAKRIMGQDDGGPQSPTSMKKGLKYILEGPGK